MNILWGAQKYNFCAVKKLPFLDFGNFWDYLISKKMQSHNQKSFISPNKKRCRKIATDRKNSAKLLKISKPNWPQNPPCPYLKKKRRGTSSTPAALSHSRSTPNVHSKSPSVSSRHQSTTSLTPTPASSSAVNNICQKPHVALKRSIQAFLFFVCFLLFFLESRNMLDVENARSKSGQDVFLRDARIFFI